MKLDHYSSNSLKEKILSGVMWAITFKLIAGFFGLLASLIFSGIFYGHYPSFGNVINSSVFPVVIVIIFVFRKYIFEIKRVKIE